MRHSRLLISLLLLLLLSPAHTLAFHNSKRSNLYFDSTFRALQHKHAFGSTEHLGDDMRAMLHDAIEQRNSHGQTLALMELARYESIEYQMDSAFAHIIKARQLMKENPGSFVEAYLHYVDATLYYVTNQYATSYSEYEAALEGFRKLDDSLFIGKMLVNMANIHTNEGIWDKSEKMLGQAYDICPEIYRPAIALYKADAKIRQGLYQESIPYIQESGRLMDKLGFSRKSITKNSAFFWRAYHHLLYYAYQRQGNIDSAIVCFNEMAAIVNQFGSEFEQANTKLVEAELLSNKGPEGKPIFICRDIFQRFATSTHTDLCLSALGALHKAYGDLGAYADAYKTMEQYAQYLDKDHQEDLHTMDLLHQYETTLLKQALAKKENSIILTAAAVSGAFVFLLCLAVIFLYFRLARKHAWIGRMRRRLIPKTPSAPAPAPRTGTPQMSKEDSRERWNTFEQVFKLEHPEFVAHLGALNSQITETEVRICMLTKKGISDSDIQQMLHLSESSVKSYRSRVRKKVGINDPDTTLEEFLQHFN